MSPECGAVLGHQYHIGVVWVPARQLTVCTFVVVAPDVDRVVGEQLLGSSACVDVTVDVVVMRLVRNCDCAVVFGRSPVFSSADLVHTIRTDLNDREHEGSEGEVPWAVE